jgi:hypothetical protein
MKTITLTKGVEIQVDDAAFARFGHLKWHTGTGGLACRRENSGGSRRTLFLHRMIAGAKDGEEVRFTNGDRTDYRRANLETFSKSQKQRGRITNPIDRATYHFLRAFPQQRRFGYTATRKQVAAVMAEQKLSPEQLKNRIIGWQETVRDMPPWDLAKPPPAPLVEFVPTPLADLPKITLADDVTEQQRARVRAMLTPWEDDGTA